MVDLKSFEAGLVYGKELVVLEKQFCNFTGHLSFPYQRLIVIIFRVEFIYQEYCKFLGQSICCKYEVSVSLNQVNEVVKVPDALSLEIESIGVHVLGGFLTPEVSLFP